MLDIVRRFSMTLLSLTLFISVYFKVYDFLSCFLLLILFGHGCDILLYKILSGNPGKFSYKNFLFNISKDTQTTNRDHTMQMFKTNLLKSFVFIFVVGLIGSTFWLELTYGIITRYYISTKNENKYIELLSKLAEKEYNKAQYQLGIEFIKGRFVDINENKAIYWLYKSYKNGNNDAINDVNGILRNDSIDILKCKDLLKNRKVLANLGDYAAAFHVGEMYFFGNCTNVDYHEAYRYHRMAAMKNNDTNSMIRLGEMFERGYINNKIDLVTAFAWYWDAGKHHDNKLAKCLIGKVMYKQGKIEEAKEWLDYCDKK